MYNPDATMYLLPISCHVRKGVLKRNMYTRGPLNHECTFEYWSTDLMIAAILQWTESADVSFEYIHSNLTNCQRLCLVS